MSELLLGKRDPLVDLNREGGELAEEARIEGDVLQRADHHEGSRLAETPRFDRELPLFFRLGFPTPRHPAGEGLQVGAPRSVMFAHEGHHSGTLSLKVVESTPTRVRFAAVSDDSYLTHWLRWREAVVELQPVGRGQTRVRWTLRYSRRLDPSWYFDPLERYGVSLAAQYLLDDLTTPPQRSP